MQANLSLDRPAFLDFVKHVESGLASCAAFSEEAERWNGEKAMDCYNESLPGPYLHRLRFRTPYQHDRDSILYSSFFAPLAHKTQLIVGTNASILRTRLTHTLIVAQIGKSIARGLRLNEDLVEAMALGHDIGHTPFAHAGERGLNKWLKEVLGRTMMSSMRRQRTLTDEPMPLALDEEFVLGKNEEPVELLAKGSLFMHGRQSLKKLEDFEKCNLTKQVLFGILRHSRHPSFPDEEFRLIRGDRCLDSKYATFESDVLKLADDIAWVSHDIEDARRASILGDNDIEGLVVDQVGTDNIHIHDALGSRSSWLTTFIYEAITYNSQRELAKDKLEKGEQHLELSAPYEKVLDSLKSFVVERILNHPEAQRADAMAERVVQELCRYYDTTDPRNLLVDLKQIRKARGGDPIDFPFHDEKSIRDCWKEPQIRAVRICDFVSALTDAESTELHERHFSPKFQLRPRLTSTGL
jgi:dGTPase